jgi:hypothetical protein
MNEQGARHWAEVRKRGIWRFLLFSIPIQGIPVAFSFMMFRVLSGVEREQLGGLLSDFGRRILTWGFCLGLYTWWSAEKKYKKYRQKLGLTDAPMDDDIARQEELSRQVRDDIEWKHFDRVTGPLIGGITMLCIIVLALWVGPCSSRF